MTCPLCQKDFTPRGKRKQVYCMDCIKSGEAKTHRLNLLRKIHYCWKCGKEIPGKSNYCDECNTHEARLIRARTRQQNRITHCTVCGVEIRGYATYCKEHRTKVNHGQIQKLTLDNTLFFLIVRKISLKEAAHLQQIRLKDLEKYMEEQKDTLQYKKLAAHYEKVRQEREGRKAA